ncbi:MAG: hypothetical protein Q9163_002714 [Psora crenata]
MAEDTNVKPPHCATWKSEFAYQLALKEITEEFEHFASKYMLGPQKFAGPDAVMYALDRKTTGLQDRSQEATELPVGSKVCIVGAGMAGWSFLPYESQRYQDLTTGQVGAMRFPDVKIMEKYA